MVLGLFMFHFLGIPGKSNQYKGTGLEHCSLDVFFHQPLTNETTKELGKCQTRLVTHPWLAEIPMVNNNEVADSPRCSAHSHPPGDGPRVLTGPTAPKPGVAPPPAPAQPSPTGLASSAVTRQKLGVSKRKLPPKCHEHLDFLQGSQIDELAGLVEQSKSVITIEKWLVNTLGLTPGKPAGLTPEKVCNDLTSSKLSVRP